MGERRGPPMALDAGPGFVAILTAAGIEGGGKAVGLEPPQTDMGARRVGAVALPAARRAMAEGALASFRPWLMVIDRQNRVAPQPGPLVIERLDHSGTRARDLTEAPGRVALTTFGSDVPAMGIGVAVDTAGTPHRKRTIHTLRRQTLPLFDREG